MQPERLEVKFRLKHLPSPQIHQNYFSSTIKTGLEDIYCTQRPPTHRVTQAPATIVHHVITEISARD